VSTGRAAIVAASLSPLFLRALSVCALSLCVLSIGGCRAPVAQTAQETTAKERTTYPGPLHDLDWLAGCWRGGDGDKIVEETWTEPTLDRMLATGRTVDVKSGRTIFFEFLRIEARGDRLVYIALPRGRGETAFMGTKVEKHRLRFENPEHDDPKVIEYRLEADGTLVTRVEGTHIEEIRLRRVW
jgi:hypothetical protein